MLYYDCDARRYFDIENKPASKLVQYADTKTTANFHISKGFIKYHTFSQTRTVRTSNDDWPVRRYEVCS